VRFLARIKTSFHSIEYNQTDRRTLMPAELATISRDELKQKIDNKDYFFLVETLAPEYYNYKHLPGAINLPPDKVRELAPTLLPEKTAEIVVYCAFAT
jgi:rhodanese-related sulfurtransferase